MCYFSQESSLNQHIFHFIGDESSVANEITMLLVRQRFREVERAYEAIMSDSQTKRHVWCAGVNAGVLLALTEVNEGNLLLDPVTGSKDKLSPMIAPLSVISPTISSSEAGVLVPMGKVRKWRKYFQSVIGKKCMNYLKAAVSVVVGLWPSSKC